MPTTTFSLRTMLWISYPMTAGTLTTGVIVNILSYFEHFLIMTCQLTVWSNFEIADLDLWRGEAYTKFFEFLDQKGGFYYEVRPFYEC
jgi:hypothetical protein